MNDKGLKYDSKKVPLNLLSNYAIEELAKVLQFGAEKYEPWNWAKGIEFSRLIAAAKRHIAEWENRNDIDSESKTNHLANAMCNLMFILDYQKRNLTHLDDRRPINTLISDEKQSPKYIIPSGSNIEELKGFTYPFPQVLFSSPLTSDFLKNQLKDPHD